MGETPLDGVIREVTEEIGVSINPTDLHYIDPPIFALNTPDGKDFIFHRFWVEFPIIPLLYLDLDEHTEAIWLSIPDILLELPLMEGGREALIEYETYRTFGGNL